MEITKQASKFTLFVLIALLTVSHFAHVESKCVKRNFKYPTPGNKQVSSESSNAEQSSLSPPPPSPSPSSSSKEEKENVKESSQSTSPAVDSPDVDAESNKNRFGDMLKQVVGQIDPNSPILNIPKSSVSDPDIIKFCKTTDYPDLCESTVSHFVDGKHDAVAMLEMAIKACVQYTQLARATAKTLSASPIFAKIKARFADIDEYYVDALENLQDADNAIKVKDIATVNINLSAALDDYGAYEDDWGETSPMADFDGKLTKMASNCLAISTLVKF